MITNLLNNYFIPEISIIIYNYQDLYISKEYHLSYDTCRKYGKKTWKDDDCQCLGTRVVTNIVKKSKLSSVLKWGDVVHIGEESDYRNNGRSFWIDDQLIPFFNKYDDYGSIYPWMCCNKVGNINCWDESASGHGTYISFDLFGYKIFNVLEIDFIWTRQYDEHTHPFKGFITTLSNDCHDEWYFIHSYGNGIAKEFNKKNDAKECLDENEEKEAKNEDEKENEVDPKYMKEFSNRFIWAYQDNSHEFFDDFSLKYPQFRKDRIILFEDEEF